MDRAIGRRAFLGTTAASAVLGFGAKPASARGDDDVFRYAVSRSDAEWRAQLDEIEYYVLRARGTEAPHSSPNWNNTKVGTYCCRGCDLTLYDSLQKIELDKGWAFFRHSHRDTVMTDLDLGQGMVGDPFAEMEAMMEVHCRRCGSHLGHLVALPDVPGRPIHCINGFALNFRAEGV